MRYEWDVSGLRKSTLSEGEFEYSNNLVPLFLILWLTRQYKLYSHDHPMLIFAFLSGQCGVPKIQTSRVINGVDAKRGSWPWQILIRFMGQPHCGGSIISPFWIVTAAHCVSGKEDLKKEFKIM